MVSVWPCGCAISARRSGLDLDLAINYLSKAVAVVGPDGASRPAFQSNLGIALLDRFFGTWARPDLGAGDRHMQAAIEGTPPHSPQLQTHLINLAGALQLQVGGILARQSIDRAVETMERIWQLRLTMMSTVLPRCTRSAPAFIYGSGGSVRRPTWIGPWGSSAPRPR